LPLPVFKVPKDATPMIFSSVTFLFLFLPIVLAGSFLLENSIETISFSRQVCYFMPGVRAAILSCFCSPSVSLLFLVVGSKSAQEKVKNSCWDLVSFVTCYPFLFLNTSILPSLLLLPFFSLPVMSRGRQQTFIYRLEFLFSPSRRFPIL